MKKYLAFFLVLLLSVSWFAGCENIPLPEFTPAIDVTEPFVGFRAESMRGIDIESYTRVDLQTLQNYQSVYGAYAAHAYYDTLTAEQQTVYRILQYALDHGMRCLFIDTRVLPDVAEQVNLILDCLALDHPMVDQNLFWTHGGTAQITIPNPNPFSKEPGQTLSGVLLDIAEFDGQKLEKKKAAIAVAEKVLKDLPESASDREKAEFIYRYLGNHVEYYVAEDRGPERDFLYDALVEGKSLCDGFANAYSLLCNMAGVPCAEKMFTPTDNAEDNSGHTWNAVCLEGVWYNVDATGADEVKQEYPTLMNFGFSDALLEYDVDLEERAPKCTRELIEPDVTVSKTSKAGSQVKTAWKSVKKTGRNYVIVCFPEGKPKDSVMQKIANSLQKGITYVSKVTRTGEAIYYIFPE